MGRTRRAVRPADLGDLPSARAEPRRHRGRPPGSLAFPGGTRGQPARGRAALPGWLATTTRRECLRVRRAGRPQDAWPALDAETLPDDRAVAADQRLLAAERQAALREALLDLPSGGQRLIGLLLEDPPLRYAEISVRLGMPVGSIGPNRRRYLAKMRRHPAIAALISAEAPTA